MNRKKVEEYSILLKDSAAILQADTELWKQFLHFATQFTHYRFRDQLLIYAQNQQATACATFAQWKKIGRYVRSGEHSIVLLDETGNRPRLKHVFDVTSTGPAQEFAYKPKPILPEEREELARKLNASYAKEKSLYAADAKRWDNNLEQTLSQVAMYMVQVVLVYKCRQKKLNSLYYKKKEQRRCSTWRKIKNRILRNSSSRSSISTMPEVPHILNWNMNMA